MNYTEIVSAALGYADRERDAEAIALMPTFLRIVESRVTKMITVREMSWRATLMTIKGKEYYGLPPDFKSLRDIQYKGNDAPGLTTLEYANPKQVNDLSNTSAIAPRFYTLVAHQLQIAPPPGNGTLEIIYLKRIPALEATGVKSTNWVSEGYPEIYIFGLCAEIAAFAKDAAALRIWDERFRDALMTLEDEDSMLRWSGTPLKVRLG